MSDESEGASEWHLDKRVPIGLIGAMVVQTMVFVYFGTSWKSDMEHRLGSLEENRKDNSSQSSRLIILEQNFTFIKAILDRIERKIDADPPLPSRAP